MNQGFAKYKSMLIVPDLPAALGANNGHQVSLECFMKPRVLLVSNTVKLLQISFKGAYIILFGLALQVFFEVINLFGEIPVLKFAGRYQALLQDLDACAAIGVADVLNCAGHLPVDPTALAGFNPTALKALAYIFVF